MEVRRSPTLFAISVSLYAVLSVAQAELEEIVVTATKRDASLQDVGLSISAITEKDIREKGIDDFLEYANRTPGLSFADRGPGQQFIVVRGVSANSDVIKTDAPEAKSTVGIYIDETPISVAGFSPDLKTYDLQRIEVLRGPQGTLFGAGSLAGTIRLISNRPVYDAIEGSASLTLSRTAHGDFNQELNGAYNVPLMEDKVALRLTGYAHDNGGFIDNVAPAIDPRHAEFGSSGTIENVNTEDTFGGRVQLGIRTGDNTELLLKAYYQETRLGGSQNVDRFEAASPFPGDNTDDAMLGDYEQNRLLPEIYDDEFSLYALELRHNFSFGELVSSTSYMTRDIVANNEASDVLRFFGIPTDTAGAIRNTTDIEGFTQEIRLVSTSGSAIEWIGGIFFSDEDKTFVQDYFVPGLGVETLQDFGDAFFVCTALGCPVPGETDNLFESTSIFDEQQIAVFGEVAWNISDVLRVIAGVRWFDYDQDFFFGENQGAFSQGLTATNKIADDGVNPKLSIEYNTDAGTLLYLTASEGFRLGGNNDPVPDFCALFGGPPGLASFEPDSLWSYEVGAKGQFGERIRYSGSAYFIDWSDAHIGLSVCQGLFTNTQNAANVTVLGTDWEFTTLISDQVEVGASFGYTNSEYEGNNADIGYVDGQETPLVPEFTASVDFDYSFPLPAIAGDNPYGFLSADWSYRSKQFNVATAALRTEQDPYDILNARIGLGTDRWRLALFVDNLLDERALLYKDIVFLSHNRDSINQPRTVGVTLDLSF